MTDLEYIQEISKRDKVITNLLMEKVARQLSGYRFYEYASIKDTIKDLNFETYELDQLIRNRIDQEILDVYDRADDDARFKGDVVGKAEYLALALNLRLSEQYFKGLRNELKIAIDQKRIKLLKDV